jgi:Domain of unknown function (DUF4112)
MIPFAGDVFDAVWKANQRNVALLNAHFENPSRAAATSRGFVLVLAILLIAFIFATSVLGFMVLRWVWQALAG